MAELTAEIKELLVERRRLEFEILSAIRAFEDKYDNRIVVSSVNLERITSIGLNESTGHLVCVNAQMEIV